MNLNLHVPIEEIEQDIEKTKKEVEAYEKLVSGYTILASLGDHPNPRIPHLQAQSYQASLNGCRAFLQSLEQLITLRKANQEKAT